MSVVTSRFGALLLLIMTAVSLHTSWAQSSCEVGKLWATYVSQNKFTLNWSRNPGCVTKYSVCLKTTGGTREQCETLFNFIIQWSATSLQACTNYTATLAALGSDGSRGPNSTLFIVTAPQPVIGIDVVERSDDYVIVDWSPSDSTCASQYSITWCALVDYGSRCNFVNAINMTTDTTELKMDGLEACTSYRISISAVGVQGTSDTVRVTGTTSSIDVATVSDVTVILKEMGRWQLNWKAPTRGVNCFDYYYVCTQMSGDSAIHCGVSYNTSLTSKVQHPCTDYTANVSIHLRAGGFTNNVTLQFSTRPGDVTNVQANSTSSSISVEWGVSSNDYSCVTSYLVSWCQSAYPEDCDADHRALVAADPNNTRHVIEGLDACTLYPVAVEAVSHTGTQSEPVTLNIRTKVDAELNAVRNLRTTRVTEDIITVAWQQPDNYKCVANYSACVHTTNSFVDESCDVLPRGRLRWSTTSQLQPSTSYTVVVAPVDYDGNRGANASVSVLA